MKHAWLDRLCAEDPDPLLATSTIAVVPHPDDETIGLGGRLPRLEGTIFVYVTDGAPRNMVDATAAGLSTQEQYANARVQELTEALALAGIEICQTRRLELVDQEASFDLAGLAARLGVILDEIHAEVILTPAYEGGHPDHDAAAFAVHAAAALLEQKGFDPPTLIEYALYHDRNGAPSASEFLPWDDGDERTLALSPEARTLKRKMLASFKTQQRTLQLFPTELERFRLAPRYDFTLPPHAGTLYYERFDWGMTGPRWRTLARQALHQLGLEMNHAMPGERS